MTSTVKIIIAIVVIVLLIVIVGSVKEKETSGPTGEPIVIGAVLPLTGIGANYGEYERDALFMARDRINEEGGILDRPVTLVIEDDETNPAKTATSVSKLASLDGAQVIVGAVWDFWPMPPFPWPSVSRLSLYLPRGRAGHARYREPLLLQHLSTHQSKRGHLHGFSPRASDRGARGHHVHQQRLGQGARAHLRKGA